MTFEQCALFLKTNRPLLAQGPFHVAGISKSDCSARGRGIAFKGAVHCTAASNSFLERRGGGVCRPLSPATWRKIGHFLSRQCYSASAFFITGAVFATRARLMCFGVLQDGTRAPFNGPFDCLSAGHFDQCFIGCHPTLAPAASCFFAFSAVCR